MNIIKKIPKFSYIEKRNKDNKDYIDAKLSGHAMDLVGRRISMGESLVHEMNKHINYDYKNNYNQINWDKKTNYIKKIENKIKNKYKYIY